MSPQDPIAENSPGPWQDSGWRLPAAVFGQGKISAEEAAEAAGQMADVSRAGLPLSSGLRAMVEEMPAGFLGCNRLAGVLEAIAGQLEAGVSLEAAIGSQSPRFPAHVYGLLLAGIHSGRMAEVLEEFAAIRRQQAELTRRVRTILAYPALLMIVVALLSLLFVWGIIPQFARLYDDFGMELPVLTKAVLATAAFGRTYTITLIGLCLAVAALVWMNRRWVWAEQWCYAIPVIGPMWRWNRLVEFSRLMALLLGQKIALPDALRVAADGLRSAALRRACGVVAGRIEQGLSPSAAMAGLGVFPPTLRPLVVWGEQTSSLGEAFQTAAEMFELRTRVQTALVEVLFPPLIFLFICGMVAVTVMALFIPLISLIQKLS